MRTRLVLLLALSLTTAPAAAQDLAERGRTVFMKNGCHGRARTCRRSS